MKELNNEIIQQVIGLFDNDTDPRPVMVTIRCITYNHEPYIREALEGFVNQKTNFRFEAIVHDDASTDGTAEIIREYAEKYPDIIKPIYETENQYSKHDGSLTRIMNAAVRGKYVAYCEGDDYWIDPLKLQKQIDYLESHPDVTYSCHRYEILDINSGNRRLASNMYFDQENNRDKELFIFSQEYPFLKEWVTKTLTCVFRSECLKDHNPLKFKYWRDVHMVFYALKKGVGVCHSFVGGVYRISNVGVYGALSEKEKVLTSYNVNKEFYKKTHDKIIKKAYLNNILVVRYFFGVKKLTLLDDFYLICLIPSKIMGKIKSLILTLK